MNTPEAPAANPEKTALAVWKRFLPGSHPETPWLFHFGAQGETRLSYKDLNAQAHCVAAFLLDKNVQKGETVAVLSGNSPFAVTVDLGIQFSGGVVMFIPTHYSAEQIRSLVERSGSRFIFVESARLFRAADHFSSLQHRLEGIFLQEEETEDLPPDHLSTFDRIISIGKVMWRENMGRVNARKEQITPSDTYCLTVPADAAKQPEKVSYRQFAKLLDEAQAKFQEGNIRSILSVENPNSLLQRVYGYFCPLASGQRAVCISAEDCRFPIRYQPLAQAMFASPASMELFRQRAGELFAGNSPARQNRLKKAAANGMKRQEQMVAGGTVAFGIKLNHFIYQKGIYSKMRAMFGRQLNMLISDQGEISAETRLFFEDTGFRLILPAVR